MFVISDPPNLSPPKELFGQLQTLHSLLSQGFSGTELVCLSGPGPHAASIHGAATPDKGCGGGKQIVRRSTRWEKVFGRASLPLV